MSFDEEEKVEKRKFLRISFKEAVQYTLGDAHEFGGCLAQNIGEGGLRLQLNDFVPMNTKVIVELALGESSKNKVMVLNARVAWAQRIRYSDQYQVGLEFTQDHSSNESKKEVSQYVKSHL